MSTEKSAAWGCRINATSWRVNGGVKEVLRYGHKSQSKFLKMHRRADDLKANHFGTYHFNLFVAKHNLRCSSIFGDDAGNAKLAAYQ
jgi:hypothetical protein